MLLRINVSFIKEGDKTTWLYTPQETETGGSSPPKNKMNTIKAADSCFHHIYFRFLTSRGSFPVLIQDQSTPTGFCCSIDRRTDCFSISNFFKNVESGTRCTWTHHKLTLAAFWELIFRIDVFDIIQRGYWYVTAEKNICLKTRGAARGDSPSLLCDLFNFFFI